MILPVCKSWFSYLNYDVFKKIYEMFKTKYQLCAAHYAETSPNRWRTSEHNDMNVLINAI